MLVSVRCPHCGMAYPPRQMHTCRPPSIQMRVKPIYEHSRGDLAQSRTEPVKPRTLSFGAAPVSASLPTAGSSEGRGGAQVGGAVKARAAAQPIIVGGVEIDAETIATALKLLENRRKQQRNYQKRKRAKA